MKSLLLTCTFLYYITVGVDMEKWFLIQQSHASTGYIWLYVFLSLFFFGNNALSTSSELNISVESHNNVLTSEELDPLSTPCDSYIPLNHFFSMDNDDIQSCNHSTIRFAVTKQFSEKKSSSLIHQKWKNSPLTIRMVTSVLIV